MKTPHTEQTFEVCNRLLRGEISAIETYALAVHKFETEPEIEMLKGIRREHIESANELRLMIKDKGGEASTDSGAWGKWAKAVEGSSTLFGESSALKALQEGEEHGEKEYRDALDNDDIPADCLEAISRDLLPRQLRHISTLRELRTSR